MARLREDGPPLTDTQWFRIRSFVYTCSCICVGHAARGRRFVAARCGRAQAGAPWRRWVADEYGKRHAVYRRPAAGGVSGG